MTPADQNAAVAKAVGWTNIRECTCGKIPRGTSPAGADKHLPDYGTDLNAMHEAEQLLLDTPHAWRAYMRELENLAMPPLTIRADARSRREAFLRALGLYIEP